MRQRLNPGLKWLIPPALLTTLLLGWVQQKRSERQDWKRFSPPGKRVNLGSHSLYLLAMGEKQPGQPTIILESGHGDWSMAWRKVQPVIARFARVVSYDRAGFGWSDPGPLPRTPDQLVSELHALLEAARETGPYIFVGHSMGAALSRLFYKRYPDEVVGMVWIDSAHEDLASYLAFWQKAYYAFLFAIAACAVLARIGFIRLFASRQIMTGYSMRDDSTGDGPREQAILSAQLSTGKFFDVVYHETTGLMQRKHWLEGVPDLHETPVISVEAQYSAGRAWYYPRKEWQQFLTGWKSMHEDISRLSRRIRRVEVSCGHVVMVEQPQAVIDAIQEMYQWVSEGE